MAEYTLIRSKRKTLALYVRGGVLEVRAPMGLSKPDIDRFVESRQKWIEDKLSQTGEQAVKRENFRLAYGDFITYRGRPCVVAPKDVKRAGFDGEQFYMPPGLNSEQIKTICVMLYRELALQDFLVKVEQYGKIMGVFPASVRVNGAKSRWGSCSAKKSINFSWRLIMAEDPVIDYVVVHELAHLIEMNHSPRFWAVVEKIFPDYRARRARLKMLQQRLGAENWDTYTIPQ